jgi:hypothetical protein
MTVGHIFEISEDDHPPNTPTSLVTHARDIWWTLDFANAFVSPGVNSRGELVPSHSASPRRLGEYISQLIFICFVKQILAHHYTDKLLFLSMCFRKAAESAKAGEDQSIFSTELIKLL